MKSRATLCKTVGLLFVYNLGGAVCTRGLAGAPRSMVVDTRQEVMGHLLSKGPGLLINLPQLPDHHGGRGPSCLRVSVSPSVYNEGAGRNGPQVAF